MILIYFMSALLDSQEIERTSNRRFFLVIFGDFWPIFGGLSSCPDKLRENLKACRKIRTNFGKSGGLRPDKSV